MAVHQLGERLARHAEAFRGCMKEAFYVDNDGGHVLDDDTYEAGESAITRRDSCLIAPFPRVKMTF